MSDDQALIESFDTTIRRVWHDEQWFYSVVDVVGILSDAPVPRNYWADMKRKVQREGFVELLEKIQQLRMPAADGKLRLTDAADEETLLRIIQSIPSPKAEPFKQWLARVGAERLWLHPTASNRISCAPCQSTSFPTSRNWSRLPSTVMK